MYKGLDLTNKASKMPWNNYHVADMETLDEVTIRGKGVIDLERANTKIRWVINTFFLTVKIHHEDKKVKNEREG